MLELMNWRRNSMTKEIDPKKVDLIHESMKARLDDLIAEYIDDDNYSSLTFANDLNDSLKEWKKYYENKKNKVSGMIEMINPMKSYSSPDDKISSGYDIMPPWGHSDMEALRYTDEELNAMCDKASSEDEKIVCQEYNLREAEYYNQSVKK